MNLAKFKINMMLIGFNLVRERPSIKGIQATVYRWENSDGLRITLRYFNPYKFSFYIRNTESYHTYKYYTFKDMYNSIKILLRRIDG